MKSQPWRCDNHSSDINIKMNLRDGVDTVERVEDGFRRPTVENNSRYIKTENLYAVL
jgi:hypothetical protein